MAAGDARREGEQGKVERLETTKVQAPARMHQLDKVHHTLACTRTATITRSRVPDLHSNHHPNHALSSYPSPSTSSFAPLAQRLHRIHPFARQFSGVASAFTGGEHRGCVVT